jgi:AcrR family transcriptional regulator
VKTRATATEPNNAKKSARRQQRESEILSAAREVFLEKGFERASVSEIAARVDVVEGLVFRYFSTKRDLLNEVLRGLYEPLIADVSEGFARIAGLRGRLRFIVWRHLRFYTEAPGFARLILHEVRTGPGYGVSELHNFNVRYPDILRQTLQQASADGEVSPSLDYELVRSMVYGGLEHLMWPVLYANRNVDVERVADRYTDHILHGLGCTPPPTSRIEERVSRLEELLGAGAPAQKGHKL